MELRQLLTFRMVANTMSFTQAANALNYVQSSVTAQIQALETELGVRLFDRLSKRIVLTDAGQRLLWYTERILSLTDEARIVVGGSDEPMGTLTISASESLSIYRLPAVLQKFRERFPQVQLLFRPCSQIEQQRYVSEGVVDLAFILSEPIHSRSLVVEQLIVEPVVIVAPPDHRLASQPCIHPNDLAGEMVVLTEMGCSYRNIFERMLKSGGIHPTTTMEFHSVEAIKQCVMAGIGITALPAYVVANEVAQHRLIVLNWCGGEMQVVTQMVRHKEKWLSPALDAFLQVSHEVLQTAIKASTIHQGHVKARVADTISLPSIAELPHSTR